MSMKLDAPRGHEETKKNKGKLWLTVPARPRNSAPDRWALANDLAAYRSLHLIHSLGLRPELASMLASLAFGGAA